ncbi:MAG: PAS domain S-box protein [Thermodesulfobacteriota bacterium]|nr:PAS domain S-box protein [Thermodesulfobacteriota bacterium]
MEYKLSELIEIERSQELLDSLCDAVGVAAAIIDLEGQVLVGSRWQRICTDFHRVSEKTAQKCIESDTQLANKLRQGEQFTLYCCKNGLTDAASPIVIEGEHVANAFVGQFLLESPDIDFFRQQAADYGFEEKSYLDSLSNVPIVEEKRLPIILNFLKAFAESVATTALGRLRQLEAGKALRKSEEKYRTLIETTSQGVWLVDREQKTLDVNQSLCDMLGYSREEIIGKSPLCFADDENRKIFERQMGKIKETPHRTYEITLKRKTGEDVYTHFSATTIFDESGAVTGSFAMIADITELKQAEKKLRESEERLRLAMDAGDHGFWDWDLDTDEVYFSPRYCTMLGYEPGELPMVKDTWTGLMHPEDRETIVPRVQNYAENAERYEVEFRLKCKDGSWKWICGKGKGFELDENGRPWRAVGLHVDITERKQAEREKKRLESQLRQAQKMEAIGTLAGGIAHDFNNILAAIIGYAELSFEEAQEGSSLQEYLKEIFSAGNRAKDLVKQILAFSREAEQKSKPVKVGRIAEEALKLLRASLPTTIAIRQDIQSNSTILADSTQIHQVLMNLCANAGQAMEERGGALDVSLVDVELGSDFTVKHPGTRPGPYIKLTVSDTGHGMAPDVLGRVFDPYFSTKEPDEGTGLGLSVVHGIVRSCGGTITAHSEPEKGSAFNVFFPVIESKAEVEIRPDKPVPKGTERVLFIDDEHVLVNIGKQMLESLGYEVTTKTDGIEALELFKTQPDRFDVVITDMTMPKVTGADVAAELMRIRPDVPVVLCTGFSTKINRKRAMAMGIGAFVYKPILKREIAKAIRQVLDDN